MNTAMFNLKLPMCTGEFITPEATLRAYKAMSCVMCGRSWTAQMMKRLELHHLTGALHLHEHGEFAEEEHSQQHSRRYGSIRENAPNSHHVLGLSWIQKAEWKDFLCWEESVYVGCRGPLAI